MHRTHFFGLVFGIALGLLAIHVGKSSVSSRSADLPGFTRLTPAQSQATGEFTGP
jgi:hypothetical protein